MPEKEERSEAEIVGLKVVSVDPSEVGHQRISSSRQRNNLTRRSKRAERILSFDDPDNPEEPIHVHLRALTSNEEAILHQSNISKKDVQSLVSVFLEKTETEKDGKLEPSDITDIVAEKIANNSEDEEMLTHRFYRRIQMAIIKPTGVTIEWLKRRNPNMLDFLNDTIDELQAENDMWLFQNGLTEKDD